MDSILESTRIYVAACKYERMLKLPAQLVKLKLPHTIEREPPSYNANGSKQYGVNIWFDPPSRRFRRQCMIDVDKPFLWLEDDIDIPDCFLNIWSRYEKNLPADWKVAVLGWGIIYDEGVRIRNVSPGWWHLDGGKGHYAAFSGSQAVLVNAGDWRRKLAKKEFRCDVGLCGVLKGIGITQIYHSDKVLIGTNDPHTTFGDAVVQYSKMSEPRYFGWKVGYRAIRDDDFIR